MPAEDQKKHWAEGLDRCATVFVATVATVAFVYWLFVYWSMGNPKYAYLDAFGDGNWKQVFRLAFSSLVTVVLLGSEVILFRWWFRR